MNMEQALCTQGLINHPLVRAVLEAFPGAEIVEVREVTSRHVQTIAERDMLAKFVTSMEPPFTASFAKGKRRSTEQNRMSWKWMTEIAEQRGDEPAEYWRGYCKLRFGVPILRRDNEVLKEKYDRILKPLGYEEKVELMMEPMALPVTSLMTVKQEKEYLDAIHRHFAEQGVILTQPEQNT